MKKHEVLCLLTAQTLNLRRRKNGVRPDTVRSMVGDGAPRVRPAPGSNCLSGAIALHRWQPLDTDVNPPKTQPSRTIYCQNPH